MLPSSPQHHGAQPAVSPADHPASGGVQPQMGMRSIHMHTLHPIEGPPPWTAVRVRRAGGEVDWVIKNRGNDLQW